MTRAERQLLRDALALLARHEYGGAVEVDGDLSDDRQAACCPECERVPRGAFSRRERDEYDLPAEGHERRCQLRGVLARGRRWLAVQS